MSYGDPDWRPWVLPADQGRDYIIRAFELGINFFDTANMYSRGKSEEIVGQVLSEVAPRDEVVIATKVYFPLRDGPNQGGLSRKHILDAIDASLARLRLDYVDLYQVHRWDPKTPLEETLRALEDILRSGRARYIGASSMYAWQFARALYTADRYGWSRFASMQNHWNLVYREEEREMVPLCLAEGVGLIPWSPLARGFLAGNRSQGGEPPTPRAASDDYAKSMYYRPEDFAVAERLDRVAAARDNTPAQVALAWLLAKDGVTAPIIGATKPHHLEEAVAALEIQLAPEELAALEEPYVPHRVLGHS